MIPFSQKPYLTIITGHYGVGKTNFSLNLARDLRKAFARLTLVDLDIVNPYFRSTDSLDFLNIHNIDVLGPVYARSTLDTPSLAPGIDEAIIAADAGHAVLIDVGGDSDGARALGRYSKNIVKREHRLVYLVNFSRPDTAGIKENIEVLKSIEAVCGLKVSHVIGNTHLKQLSSAKDIANSIVPTLEFAKSIKASCEAITVPRALASELCSMIEQLPKEQQVRVYPVDSLVQTPWE